MTTAKLPNASVTLSGAVNKAGYGLSCFAIVVKDITVNGTGMITPNGQCLPAGLTMATSYGIESTVVFGTPTTVQTSAFTVKIPSDGGVSSTT